MDRGAWRARAHEVAKSQTGLSDYAQHVTNAAVICLQHPLCDRDSDCLWLSQAMLLDKHYLHFTHAQITGQRG